MDKQNFGGNGPNRRNRQAVPLSKIFEEGLDDSSIRKVMVVVELKKLWVSLMGDRMAQVSYPYRLKEAVLYVAVRDAIWIAELPYMKEEMIKKLTETGVEIQDIRFTLSKLKKKQEKQSRPRATLTAKDIEWIDKTASKIEDTKYRQSFKAALTAFKQKG